VDDRQQRSVAALTSKTILTARQSSVPACLMRARRSLAAALPSLSRSHCRLASAHGIPHRGERPSTRRTGERLALGAVAAAAVGCCWSASSGGVAMPPVALAEPSDKLPSSESSSNAVVTQDKAYMEGIKLYGIGIKDDPVPGEKRGKGMQRLNSSYWMLDLASFISKNYPEIRAMVQYAYDQSKQQDSSGFDFRYFVNCSNALFIKAENEGLRTKDSLDYFLMAAW
jgi:hypothetical protein